MGEERAGQLMEHLDTHNARECNNCSMECEIELHKNFHSGL